MSQTRDKNALQSQKWQLIGMSQWYHSALYGHPLPTLTDSWVHSAASRHTTAPISHTRPSPHSPQVRIFPLWHRSLSFGFARQCKRSLHGSWTRWRWH